MPKSIKESNETISSNEDRDKLQIRVKSQSKDTYSSVLNTNQLFEINESDLS